MYFNLVERLGESLNNIMLYFSYRGAYMRRARVTKLLARTFVLNEINKFKDAEKCINAFSVVLVLLILQ